MHALSCRLDFFLSAGCVVSDHSLEGCFYVPCTAAEANDVFEKRMNGGVLTEKELGMYKGFISKHSATTRSGCSVRSVPIPALTA